ncbi:MAG: hypothetical protein HY787_04675 [Deltaproteobacteria bacterium]|nr:hypothetical protein [Deltaproteobacteria bacterium]
MEFFIHPASGLKVDVIIKQDIPFDQVPKPFKVVSPAKAGVQVIFSPEIPGFRLSPE